MVKDGLILEALYLPGLRQRFDDLQDPHEGTFSWIFNSPKAIHAKEPNLITTFPDWLSSGSGIFHVAGKPG